MTASNDPARPLSGRQLWRDLRNTFVVVVRVPSGINRKALRDALCWRGMQRMDPEREALLRQIARQRYNAKNEPKPLTPAQLQARRALATERLMRNATNPPKHPAKLRAAAKRNRIADQIRALRQEA